MGIEREMKFDLEAALEPDLEGLGAAVDVLRIGARQAGDHGVLGAPGDFADRLEVAFRGDRKAGLDDVDAHVVEHLGDLDLLLEGHGRAGTLFAVTQRGVENNDAFTRRDFRFAAQVVCCNAVHDRPSPP